VSGLRDLNKAKRRDSILDAAIALFNDQQSDDVSTEQIAALAGVAPATVYNLIGTRDDLMHALIRRVVAQLADSVGSVDSSDPIATAELIVEQTVRAFVADSTAFRQVVASAQRTAFERNDLVDPSEYQVAAMRQAQTLGFIRDDIDAAGLGRQIFLSYTGAIVQWSSGRLDDAGFLIAAMHGLFTVLAAAGTDEHREQFLKRLRSLAAALQADAWSQRTDDEVDPLAQ
jgi:AcrR family transcriptional regulator